MTVLIQYPRPSVNSGRFLQASDSHPIASHTLLGRVSIRGMCSPFTTANGLTVAQKPRLYSFSCLSFNLRNVSGSFTHCFNAATSKPHSSAHVCTALAARGTCLLFTSSNRLLDQTAEKRPIVPRNSSLADSALRCHRRRNVLVVRRCP